MDAYERLKIEQECRDLVTKLNHYHDHRRAEDAVALFAEDGCWIRRGRPIRGAAELLASFKRGGTRVNRHVGAATLITVRDENHAEGVTYYLAFHHDPGTFEAKLPLPGEPPSMGEWHDKFVRTPQGWRFAERQTLRVFAGGAE